MSLTKVTNSMIKGAAANVLDFGAIGNGVADDTAAIQAAANSLPNGGSLYIPKGTYKVSAKINFNDKTTVFGDGIGATLIQGTSTYAGTILSCANASGTTINRAYFHIHSLSVDGANTLNTTSTALVGGDFAQWVNTGGKQCIVVANTKNVLIENVFVSNSGYGIIAADCDDVIIQNFEATGHQWDCVSTYRIQENLTVQNFTASAAGRNGCGIFQGKENITVQNFNISNCWIEGIEVEQLDIVASLKQVTISNGFISDCGTFAQIETYGTNSLGVIENCTFSAPKSHSGFNNLTTGEADQQYNLNTGTYWNGTPRFPVPNAPGSWPNIRYSGIQFEGLHGVARNNSFINISLVAGAFAYGDANAAPNMDFVNNLFISSNVRTNKGDFWTFTGNNFNGSTFFLGESSGTFDNEPKAIIANNTFQGASNVTLQDNCLFTGNILIGVVGVAISAPVPSDGRTIISNNAILDANSSSTTIGIDLEFQTANNTLIENNYIDGMTTTGIALYDGGTARGYVVTGNRIQNSVIGVSINGGNGDVIQNNVMRGNTYDIKLTGIGGSAAAGTGVRIVGNLLQSTTSVYADDYFALPGTTRFCNNEFTALNPTNIFSWGGSNVVQGNWS